MNKTLDDIKADDQHIALVSSIKSVERFISYAKNSRFAVPGEVDIALESLYNVYELQYGEEYLK